MRFRRVVATGIASAALAGVLAHVSACGQFGATSDTAASTDAVALPVDGATDVTSDEGGADGAIADAAANADGGPTEDAACGHLFCADFDGAKSSTGWSGVHVSGGASTSLAGAVGSPGNAMRSTIPASSTSDDYAYVAQEFAGETALHAELDINVPSTPLDPSTVLTILEISGNGFVGNQAGASVQFLPATPNLAVYLASGSSPGGVVMNTTVELPTDTWTHLVLDVRFGSLGHVKLVVGGTTALDQSLSSTLPATPELRVGVQHYNGSTPAFSALFDTVRVDRLP